MEEARDVQARLAALASVRDLEEAFFGAGGSRRADDGLRHTYVATRVALLEGALLQRPLMRDESYQHLRGQLLRSRFPRRVPTREAVRRLEEPRPLPVSAAPVALPPARVADAYAFAGMGPICDHHRTAVVRCVFANGDATRLALACADGSVSVVDAATGAVVLALPRPKASCAARDLCWSLTNEWLLVGYRLRTRWSGARKWALSHRGLSSGVAALYTVACGKLLRFVREASAVMAVAFHPSNPNHFLVCAKASATLYNASTGLALLALPLGYNPATLTCASFAGDWVFVGTAAGRVRAYRGYELHEEVQLPQRAPVAALQYRQYQQRTRLVREVLVSVRGARQTLGVLRFNARDRLALASAWFDAPR